MADSTYPSEDWQACPEGTLCRLGRIQQTNDRRTALRRTSFSAVAAVAIATTLVVTAGLASGSGSVRVRCPECHKRFQEFHDHQTGEHSMSDARKVNGMKDHFKRCGGCRKQFEKKYPGCPVSQKCRRGGCCGKGARELTAAPCQGQPACFPTS